MSSIVGTISVCSKTENQEGNDGIKGHIRPDELNRCIQNTPSKSSRIQIEKYKSYDHLNRGRILTKFNINV